MAEETTTTTTAAAVAATTTNNQQPTTNNQQPTTTRRRRRRKGPTDEANAYLSSGDADQIGGAGEVKLPMSGFPAVADHFRLQHAVGHQHVGLVRGEQELKALGDLGEVHTRQPIPRPLRPPPPPPSPPHVKRRMRRRRRRRRRAPCSRWRGGMPFGFVVGSGKGGAGGIGLVRAREEHPTHRVVQRVGHCALSR